jgi:hypothetical protein
VRIQFRPQFTRVWQNRAELPGGSGSGGSFRKALTVVRSGTFRACYRGGSWLAASCGSTDVTVNLGG